MVYELIIDDVALEQLRGLSKEVRRNIGYRLEALRNSFQGDVKKLEGNERRYRLGPALIASCFGWTSGSFTCML